MAKAESLKSKPNGAAPTSVRLDDGARGTSLTWTVQSRGQEEGEGRRRLVLCASAVRESDTCRREEGCVCALDPGFLEVLDVALRRASFLARLRLVPTHAQTSRARWRRATIRRRSRRRGTRGGRRKATSSRRWTRTGSPGPRGRSPCRFRRPTSPAISISATLSPSLSRTVSSDGASALSAVSPTCFAGRIRAAMLRGVSRSN